MNKVMLLGRLAKEPELRYTQTGTPVATFTLATNRKYAAQNGEREADFINCVAWQKSAEFVANYFKKGQQMALEGRIQVRSYDDNDGQRKWVTEVIAEQIEFVGAKADGSKPAQQQNNNPGLGLGEEVVFDDNDLPF
jgi:single-strand DNA-binding protein